MKRNSTKQTAGTMGLALFLALMGLIAISYILLMYVVEKRADGKTLMQFQPQAVDHQCCSTVRESCRRILASGDTKILKPDDRSLSPYFFIKNGDPEIDRMPLKSTSAEVTISGVIAAVKVSQLYKNEGDKAIEAIYVFPASTRAAVHAMRMTIGERIIEADIKKRGEARRIYDKAIEEGRTASLLEQQRPNVFQMNVGNIQPGDEIKVELFYVELLVPEEKVYEFVYPTVVGPRYSETPEQGAPDSEKWIKNPYLHEGEAAGFSFGLAVDLRSGIPISEVASPSHDLWVEYDSEKKAAIRIDENPEAGNRDFVLRFSLSGKQIESGLMLYPGDEENFFLMMMEPPKRVAQSAIVPREYIFIIDVSGSMSGFPLDVTKKLMHDLFSSLNPGDFFNILFFESGNRVLSPASLPATAANMKRAIAMIDSSRGGGGTRLVPALKQAMKLPHTVGTSRMVVIATDGYVSVEKDAFELIGRSLGQANLFSFGIGSSVNRFIIEGMARAGLGEPFIVLDGAKAAGIADRFRRYISSPILQGIQVDYEDFEAYDVEPLSLPDLFADRPLILFGKYRGEPKGEILVRAHAAGESFERSMLLSEADLSEDNHALRYLWARRRIQRLADMNKLAADDKRVAEVTNLGLKYNLMTDYTSFVAVDKQVRGDGTVETVKQPLPLPQGVSDAAVGGSPGVMASRGRSGGGYGMAGAAYGGAGKAMGRKMKSGKMSRALGHLSDVMSRSAPMEEVEAEGLSLAATEKSAAPKSPEKKKDEKSISVKVGSDPIIMGALDKNEIQRVIQSRLTQIRYCYENQLQKHPTLAGRVMVSFIIKADGKVAEVKIAGSTLKNKQVEQCIIDLLSRLRFARKSEGEINVRYPFVFKAK